MGRVLSAGFETQSVYSEGMAVTDTASALSIDTTHARLGIGACMKVVPAGASATVNWNTAFATGADIFLRWYVGASANPSANVDILSAYNGSGNPFYVRWATNGIVSIRDSAATVHGSTASALATGVDGSGKQIYHLMELRVRVGTTTTGQLEFKVNGTTICNVTTANLLAATWRPYWGSTGSVTSSGSFYFDDIAINNTTSGSLGATTSQNSWAGEGKIIHLLPTADNSVGAGWQKPGGTTTGLYTSIDNVPPVGVADSTSSADAEKMIRCPSGTPKYSLFVQSYTAGGIGASDAISTVNIVAVMARAGASGGAAGITGEANPNITVVSSSAVVAAGTFPTGWTTRFGNVYYQPTVTLGTQPQISVTQTSTIALVAYMALQVEYVPTSTIVDKTGGAASAASAGGDKHLLGTKASGATSARSAGGAKHLLVSKSGGATAVAKAWGRTPRTAAAFPSRLKTDVGRVLIDANGHVMDVMRGFNLHAIGDFPQQTFDDIYAEGGRFLRIIVRWDNFEPTEGTLDAANRTKLDNTIARAAAAGLYCMIELHLIGGGYPAWIGTTYGDGSDPGEQQFLNYAVRSGGIVEMLANRYGNPSSPQYAVNVVGFGPNELPCDDSTVRNGNNAIPYLEDIQRQMISRMRLSAPSWIGFVCYAYAAQTPLRVAGTNPSMTEASPTAYDAVGGNVVIDVHDYLFGDTRTSPPYDGRQPNGTLYPVWQGGTWDSGDQAYSGGGTGYGTGDVPLYPTSDANGERTLLRAQQAAFWKPYKDFSTRADIPLMLGEWGWNPIYPDGVMAGEQPYIDDKEAVWDDAGLAIRLQWNYDTASVGTNPWSARPGGDWTVSVEDEVAQDGGYLVVDTLAGGVDAALSAHTTDSGAPWIDQRAGLRVSAGGRMYAARPGGASDDSRSILDVDLADAYEISADLVVVSLVGQIGLCVAMAGAANTYYLFMYNASAGAWFFYEVVAGGYSQIGSSISDVPAVGETVPIVLQYRPDGVSAFFYGIRAFDVDLNPSIPAGGAGAWSYGTWTDSTGLQLDNVRVAGLAPLTTTYVDKTGGAASAASAGGVKHPAVSRSGGAASARNAGGVKHLLVTKAAGATSARASGGVKHLLRGSAGGASSAASSGGVKHLLVSKSGGAAMGAASGGVRNGTYPKAGGAAMGLAAGGDKGTGTFLNRAGGGALIAGPVPNLVQPDPSFETQNSGLVAINGSGVTRTFRTDGAYDGSVYVRVLTTGAVDDGIAVLTALVAPSAPIVISAYVRGQDGQKIRLKNREADAGATFLREMASPTVALVGTGWQRITWATTPSADAYQIRPKIVQADAAQGVITFDVDAVMINVGTVPGAFTTAGPGGTGTRTVLASKSAGGAAVSAAGGAKHALVTKASGASASAAAGGIKHLLVSKSGGATSARASGGVKHALVSKAGGGMSARVAGGVPHYIRSKSGGAAAITSSNGDAGILISRFGGSDTTLRSATQAIPATVKNVQPDLLTLTRMHLTNVEPARSTWRVYIDGLGPGPVDTPMRVSFYTPAGVRVQVGAEFVIPNNAPGAWIDLLSLAPLPPDGDYIVALSTGANGARVWGANFAAPTLNQAYNPSLEVNATGWASNTPAGASRTVARVNTDSLYGSWCWEAAYTGLSASAGFTANSPYTTYQPGIASSAAIAPGVPVFVRCAVKIASGLAHVAQLQIRARYLDASGAYVSESAAATINAPATGTWIDVSGFYTSNNPAVAYVGIIVYASVDSVAAGTTLTLHFDGAQIVVNPVGTPIYGDGSFPGWTWDETAGYSRSRGPQGTVNPIYNPRGVGSTVPYWVASSGTKTAATIADHPEGITTAAELTNASATSSWLSPTGSAGVAIAPNVITTQGKIAVTTGDVVSVRVWVRANASTGGSLHIYRWGSDGTWAGDTNLRALTLVAGAWQLVTATWTVTSGTGFVGFSVVAGSVGVNLQMTDASMAVNATAQSLYGGDPGCDFVGATDASPSIRWQVPEIFARYSDGPPASVSLLGIATPKLPDDLYQLLVVRGLVAGAGAARSILASKSGGAQAAASSGGVKHLLVSKAGGAQAAASAGGDTHDVARHDGGAQMAASAGGVKTVLLRKVGGAALGSAAGALKSALVTKAGGAVSARAAGGVKHPFRSSTGGASAAASSGGVKHLVVRKSGGAVATASSGGIGIAHTLTDRTGGAILVTRAGATKTVLVSKAGGARAGSAAGGTRRVLQSKSGGARLTAGAAGAKHLIVGLHGGAIAATATGARKHPVARKAGGAALAGQTGEHTRILDAIALMRAPFTGTIVTGSNTAVLVTTTGNDAAIVSGENTAEILA